MSDYQHPGWTGVPYESDFDAKWGTIKHSDMYVAGEGMTLKEEGALARSAGFVYLISKHSSPAKNRLFKVTSSNVRCVEAILSYARTNAKRGNAIYHNDLDERVKQILRNVKQRATVYDLDDADIITRVKAGVCEATGMPLNLTHVGHVFGPAIDQIVAAGGYTRENTRVVCAAFNRLKADGTDAQATEFFSFVRSDSFAWKM